MKPLTIIVPAFNVGNFIFKALESIQNQTMREFECIVINDASKDNTIASIKPFLKDERFRLVNNRLNLGKPDSIKNVLEQVSTKYLSIHDADDWSNEHRFEEQINFLEKNPDYSMCGTSFYHVTEKGEKMDVQNMPSDFDKIKEDIFKLSQFHGPTLVFKTEIIKQVGGLFRYMRMGEDIDFTMRVVEKFKATNIQEPLYFYRTNPQSLTKSYKHDIESKIIDGTLISKLAIQRKESGTDCLMTGDMDTFNSIIEGARKEYWANRESHLDKYVSHLISYNLFLTGVKTVLYRSWKDGVSIRKIRLLIFILLKKIKLR